MHGLRACTACVMSSFILFSFFLLKEEEEEEKERNRKKENISCEVSMHVVLPCIEWLCDHAMQHSFGHVLT